MIEFIAAFFFFVKNYNSTSFLVDLASRIYNNPKVRNEYNLLRYLHLGFMKLIGKKSSNIYHKYLKEIKKDLSIELILKRIIFLEHLMANHVQKDGSYSEISFESIEKMKSKLEE